MFLTKADTWKLSTIGGEKFANIIIKFTHTCYKGKKNYIQGVWLQ